MKTLRSRSAQSPPLVVRSRIIVIVPLRVGELPPSLSLPLLSLGSLAISFDVVLVVRKESRLARLSLV